MSQNAPNTPHTCSVCGEEHRPGFTNSFDNFVNSLFQNGSDTEFISILAKSNGQERAFYGAVRSHNFLSGGGINIFLDVNDSRTYLYEHHIPRIDIIDWVPESANSNTPNGQMVGPACYEWITRRNAIDGTVEIRLGASTKLPA